MAARSKARHRALDVLFEADLRDRDPRDVLSELAERRIADGVPLNPYTGELVRGVADHAERIDDVLASYAIGWTLDRMPRVDRNILRIGTYELLYRPDVPGEAAVSEAVELAKQFSTDKSPAFVNGLLGRLLQMRDSLVE